MGMMKTCGLALGALALVASGAVAQEQSTNRVAAKTDWSVFVEDNPTECWGVSFTGGYPFASGSTVNMNISGSEFELFTEGEWAWPATTADDAKIIAAMKRGADATLTARSSRGTQTKDTFSLLGFTAAVEDAAKRCGG